MSLILFINLEIFWKKNELKQLIHSFNFKMQVLITYFIVDVDLLCFRRPPSEFVCFPNSLHSCPGPVGREGQEAHLAWAST